MDENREGVWGMRSPMWMCYKYKTNQTLLEGSQMNTTCRGRGPLQINSEPTLTENWTIRKEFCPLLILGKCLW